MAKRDERERLTFYRDLSQSLVLNISLPPLDPSTLLLSHTYSHTSQFSLSAALRELAVLTGPSDVKFEQLKVTGWEKNAKGKTPPRVAELSALMDPIKYFSSRKIFENYFYLLLFSMSQKQFV
jgi:hypothetical protein